MRTRTRPMTLEVDYDAAFYLRTAVRKECERWLRKEHEVPTETMRNYCRIMHEKHAELLAELEYKSPQFMAEDLLEDGPDVDVIA